MPLRPDLEAAVDEYITTTNSHLLGRNSKAANIIALVASMLMENISQTLHDERGVTLHTAKKADWRALGYRNDYTCFLDNRETAYEILSGEFGAQHPLAVNFDETWPAIIKHYYPDET